ncbi:periplasmic component of efflux system [Aliivibrio fischeri ES114]|uniref:Periplasmic component of efflux system n=1 Tax=Aliivibrio fischeri (strain ATCC 700601 / ES114) TaxID=312309 RepID=Q5E5P0_ALIF1|nr:efflux RND transporter periplasmic adaptor subunit [Aliivibrio fischeri]AAW85656.1 periplasmic component of efflux system [Aliivibrio fischeri ES114]KLU80073.1 membrane protein [Aliivibrio fischeri]
MKLAINKYWIYLFLFSFVVVSVGYYFVRVDSQHKKLPFVVASIGSIEKKAVAVGHIVPAHSISIKSQIDGIVGEIYHQVGEVVAINTPLIKIRPNPTPAKLMLANTDLMQSEAKLELAQKKLENLKQLVEQNIIPENYGGYIEAKSDVKSNKASVQQKKQNLDLILSGESSAGNSKLNSTIVAPINGTILNLKVEIGEPIISTASNQAATVMMSIADMSDIIFKGSVSEHDASRLTVGTPATVILASYPDIVVSGKLRKVAVQSEKLNLTTTNTSTNSVKSFDNGFQVEVDQIQFPKNLTIRSGFSATAQIILQQSTNVIIIPERSLQFKGGEAEVWVIDDSEYGYSSRVVTLGLSDGVMVEVLSGLEEGEEIVDMSMMIGELNA